MNTYEQGVIDGRREERERILKLPLPIAESLEGQNADVRHGYGMAIDHWARAIRGLPAERKV